MRNARRQRIANSLGWIAVALCVAAASTVQAVTLDITSQFTITRPGFVENRTTTSTVKLTNSSGAPVLAPITVVVDGLPNGVTLANKDGVTTDGKPYLSPMRAGAQLPNGETLTFVLRFANPARTTLSYYLQVLYNVEVPANAPSLLGVVATGGTDAYVIGRVEGAASQAITLAAAASATCVSGTLVSGTAVGGTVSTTTDEEGYFAANISGVTPGTFVTISLKSPMTTPSSLCQVSSRDNDSWPKAFRLDGPTTVTARDYIDAPGRARWYKLSVSPGQRLQVLLSDLPADYDVAVFKDIGQTFLKQFDPATANTNELVRLAAETAPSTFSPSTFSPSTFSPSTFSPDAYAPSTFSPSTFSPSVYAPSTFSPSTFSPSTFSPSTFSPSTFSPSTFSPSTFSPSTFSPSIYTEDEIAKAFSTAQTRSIVAFSPVAGNGSESLVVNTWNNTGDFYLRVTGRSGAFNTGKQFTVAVTKGVTTCAGVTDTALAPRPSRSATGLKTVILADSSKVPLDESLAIPGGGTLREKLATFAARPDVKGVLVDVAGDSRVAQLKKQAADNPACPFAKNLVAEDIKGIVDSYRTNPLQYVVIVGNDDSIPFFRSPDLAELGQESSYVPPVQSDTASEASLRRDYVLSQDAYGSKTKLSLPWSDFPVPGLAVGRLIETPAEIAGIIDAYVAVGGVVVPKTSLVTGYDFLEDAANAVKSELETGTGAGSNTLITPNGKAPADPASWTATQLGDKLLGSRHDVVFLAGHFSANSALAADFTTNLLTTDLAASSVDLSNAIVFSAGCHSGYNIVDTDSIPGVTMPLDWAQAFARKRATLIAGTGYQYGDTDFLEYSERLYRNFARSLRAGTGAVSIGQALVQAKTDYLATTAPDIRGLHEKALLQATLFGLPMLGVNMPYGRGAATGGAGVIAAQPVLTGPAATLGLDLRSHNLSVAPSLTSQTLALKNILGGPDVIASWLNGPDGVVTQPGEPALPLAAVNVTPTDSSIVLRGIGFRGGTFVDSAPILPFTGAPTTEIRGVHAQFVSPVFYPARMWSPNYFGALAGNGGTQLLVTPAQHRIANLVEGTSTQRKYTNLDLRLYYSGELGAAALSDAPSIVGVEEVRNGGDVLFTAEVVGDPAAAIHQVWVTYASDAGTSWTSLDLDQCVAPLPSACGTTEDSRLWKGRLVGAPSGFRYIVQAVNGIGLVAVDDNRGSYYGISAPVPAATTLELIAPPATAAVGDTVSINVKLSFAGLGIAGKIVSVAIGGASKFGTTDADGSVTVAMPVAAVPGIYPITTSFIGDDNLLPASATSSFQLNKATASLAGLAPAGVTLTGTLGGKTQALQQEAVSFAVTGPSGPTTIWLITDHLGRAPLPPPGLPAGDYTVTSASFGGNANYAPTTVNFATSQQFNVARIVQNVTFDAIADTPFGALFTANAAASSGLPVTLAASGPCSLAGNWVQTTGVGNCTITASQAGDAVYAAAAPQQRSFTISPASQVITFGPTPTGVTVGQPLVVVSATSSSPAGAPSTIPIAFTSLSPTICSVGGGINAAFVTPIGVGACTIAADQIGDAVYNAAPQSTLSFDVGAAGSPPATFIVTMLADTNDGACNADCSLREAINAANALAGPNFVEFAPGLTGTITLTGGSIQIAGPLFLQGPGAEVLTISGNNANRIFVIGLNFPACPTPGLPVTPDGPDYLVSINNLRLANGRPNTFSSGGAIYSEHSLVLDGVVIENSAARSGAGVAFSIQYPGQALGIFYSEFINNTATELVPPTNPFAVSGGGLYVVEKCQNALDTPYTEPVSVTIVGSEFIGNRAQPLSNRDGRGGAIRSYSLADIFIADTLIVGNGVDAPVSPPPGRVYRGGGLEGTARSLRIENSEIAGNSANDATAAADPTRGGGMHIYNTSVDRQGPGDRMGVKIINSTISGNVSSASSGAIHASGNLALELINTTVSDNLAAPSRAGGIVMVQSETYPVSSTNAARPMLSLVSSIVANNNGIGGDVAHNVTLGQFTVNAFNSLIEKLCPAPNCTMFVSGTGYLVGVDPLLGPLQDNGGLSRTHALLPGSPAIDTGSNPLGLAYDQRGEGFPRVVEPAADMGAHETPSP